MKNYIGISLDTSASMRGIALAAGRDYNNTISGIREAATEHNIDTIVNVVKCGVGPRATVERQVVNSNVTALKPIKDGEYNATGNGTPLMASIWELISMMESVPDANDPDVSFVVQVITDGGENMADRTVIKAIVDKIRQLTMTDRWTFTFRVPRGYSREIISFGIPAGNVLEWDQTDKGVSTATAATKTAFRSFYAAKAAGVKSTDKFYADLSNVKISEVKKQLVDVSGQVDVYVVGKNNNGVQIRDFVEAQGVAFTKGCAFYQLNKTESVQDYKQIAIRDKLNGTVYSGFAARDMLGLPHTGEVKLAPGAHGQYEIFVQSTSVNRKLVENTNVLIWTATA